MQCQQQQQQQQQLQKQQQLQNKHRTDITDASSDKCQAVVL